ncbi:MAG: diadenylate cyclase CdaA [Acidobacteriota bacterium]|nr:MAG: TIGR00159 family protein [Acidobacteriota bacterium]
MQDFLELLHVRELANPLAIFDILLLWFAIYQLLVLIRRTRAVQMIYGLLAVFILWFITSPGSLLELPATNFVLTQLFIYGGFAVIVIFQGPIRQALAYFGRYPFARLRQQDASGEIIEEIALACSAMASRRIGALIVIERVQGLRNFIETGIEIDGRVSYDLLINIFSPKTPLHDGAVLISEGRLAAASCFLPLSTNPYISREFGTRHRAAIGITEESDAIAVVVSEERGVISAAIDGAFQQDLDARALRAFLERHLGAERASRDARRGRAARTAEAS